MRRSLEKTESSSGLLKMISDIPEDEPGQYNENRFKYVFATLKVSG